MSFKSFKNTQHSKKYTLRINFKLVGIPFVVFEDYLLLGPLFDLIDYTLPKYI